MELKEVFEKRPDILDSDKKIKSVLADFYAGDTAKINRMMKAYEVGVVASLLSGKDATFEKQKLVDLLVTQHDMVDVRAKEAIDEWYVIVSKKALSEYKKYQKAKTDSVKKEKEAKKESEHKEKKDDKTVDIHEAVTALGAGLDNYNRYVNIDRHNVSRVGIPCGVGNADHGFEIIGTHKEKYSDAQAVVHNFMLRDSHIDKKFYPQYMKNAQFTHELEYAHVFRYIMILLELIKPEGETVLELKVLGDSDELKAAQDILNEYLAVFSRLMKVAPSSVSVIESDKGKTISVTEKADYCVKNYSKDHGLIRDIKYGNKINYHLGENDKEDLEFILREISPFAHFKHGQFNALCSMLNAKDHSVCIMPTGSGKSLIYYFACILQPRVMMVVSPTDILIRDQIRNLRKFHHIDNVSHLDINQKCDYSFYQPATNMVFLTPATFQNANLFKRFNIILGETISYVTLDEIHCISNWGHDFRPEYLMLSRNLRKHLDKTLYMGFTATANYTVAQDIQKQLDIPLENFFSPIAFEKYNVRYDFRELDNTQQMLEEVSKIAAEIVRRNERAIVFTKNDEISKQVGDAIGYEADVFLKDKPEAYQQFAEGNCRILVTNEELGVGINLPNVNCTVHFGMPVAKNEYVQEIGRAGRADERVTSYVVYLRPTEENLPESLLKRETIVDNLPQILSAMSNDYSDAYHKFNCGADTSDVLFDRLIDVYSDFHNTKKMEYLNSYPITNIEPTKQLLYMLFVTGYINDWYTYASTGDQISYIIDVCDNNLNYQYDVNMVDRMQKRSTQYFTEMGNDRESIFKVARAKTIEDILRIYVDWYYDKFLYHHKEQFLDTFEFITKNRSSNSDQITEEIEDYFVLPFVKIKEDEDMYNNMSFEETMQRVIVGIGKNTMSNIERINTNRYSYKLDAILLLSTWKKSGYYDANRFERCWAKLSEEEQEQFMDALAAIFPECSDEGKLNYLNYLIENNSAGMPISATVDRIYTKVAKDLMYYGIMARCANHSFSKFVRSNV